MKRKLAVTGIVIGLSMAVFGFFVLCAAFTTEGFPVSYSSYKAGLASFGGESYTYINNNTYYVALNAYRTVKLLQTVFGILLMGIGLISAAAFGMVMPPAAPKAADAVTEVPANEDADAAADETPAAAQGETDGETAAPVSPAESAAPAAPSV